MKKILLAVSIFFILSPLAVLAQAQPATGIGSAMQVVEQTTTANNTYDTNWSLERIIGNIIYAILTLVGTIFVVFMIYAGYLWMTASGNEQKVDKSKEILRQSLIGLIVVLGAYAIAYFVISIFGSQVNIQ